MKIADQEAFAKRTGRCDSVILEMEGLSSHVSDINFTSSAKFNRSLSLKASNWGERKLPEERDTDASSCIEGGGSGLSIDGAVKKTDVQVGVESTTSRAESRGGMRRYMSIGRRSSSWIDPRRVLLFFATLSSMGTLALIYFTLSIAKINGGDDNGFRS